MEQALMNQFNRAVDRGDALVKQALLAEVETVKPFIQTLGRGGAETEPLFRLLNYDADEARLIASLVHLLGFFLSQRVEQGEKPPSGFSPGTGKPTPGTIRLTWRFGMNLASSEEQGGLPRGRLLTLLVRTSFYVHCIVSGATLPASGVTSLREAIGPG
jgi:hypothetical protein